MRCLITLLLLLALSLPARALELSAKAQISLITGSAGAELYAIFGHSGIRVYDPFYGLDVMYNYGTFNFNTPNFVLKFAQGRLLYSLSTDDYPRFLYHYQVEGRTVEEQVLDLSKEDKQKLFDFLVNNAKPENRDYRYDFFYDNCATRVRDVFEKVLGKRLIWKKEASENKKTFKNLLEPYMKDVWVNYGIYLILGMRADYYASPAQKMFLPDHLATAVGEASLEENGKTRLLAKPKILPLTMMTSQQGNGFFSPILVMSLLALALGGLTYWEHTRKIRLRGVDFTLFFLTGLAGCIFLTMWVATDHKATHMNLNMLWAVPFHVVLAFWLLKREVGKRLRWYLQAYAIFQVLILIDWFGLPQRLHFAVLPLMLVLMLRAFRMAQFKTNVS